MRNELQTVPFHGDTIYLVEHNGQPYIPVKPIVDNLGIDWKTQYRKLMARRERWGMVMLTIPSAGGAQETVSMPIRKIPAYLQSIVSRKVRPEIRTKLELYQEECDDALWDYWTKGVAVNPRVDPNMTLLSKDRYIELLESENRLLKAPKRRRPHRFVTADEITEIHKLRGQGMSTREIARHAGRSAGTISWIVRGARASLGVN